MTEPRPTVEVDTTGADEAIARAQGALDEAQARRLETVEGVQALVVPADPDQPVRTVVLVEHGGHYLADLRRHIGADYVERTAGPAGISIWCDEEFALKSNPTPEVNDRATTLACRSDGWILRGDVVVTGPTSSAGAVTSLPWTTVRLLREALG